MGHEPATCKELEDWQVKNSGGDETLNEKYIASITKKCPNCKSSIEKNGGCNHMTCHKCHYHFCWLCLGKFGKGPLGDSSGYGNHKCNIFGDEDKSIKPEDDWERFRWYSERFNNHSRSYEMEKKLDSKKEEWIQDCVKTYTTVPTFLQYYRDAIAQLLVARSTIRNSYIFGFYRPLHHPEIHKDLFEHRQNELEIHTELLSKDLEQNQESIFFNKPQIISHSKLLMNSRNALLDVSKFEQQ